MFEIVEADFEINSKSFDEFIRILVPEAKDKKIYIESRDTRESIGLKLSCDGVSVDFTVVKRVYFKDQKIVMAKSAILKLFNKYYKWGSLIGVRPTKLVRKFLKQGVDYLEIEKLLGEVYLVSDEKRKLLINVVKKEMEHLNRNSVNVYIGVPYCPTKCKYCSFASYVKQGAYKKGYSEFVECLNREIRESGEFLKERNISVESIYIGGGTPTSLEKEELREVLVNITRFFDMEKIKEFTVEAGRIDTINEEKLRIMKEFGVDRISINPQTFNEKTLKEVNRYYSEDEFLEVYRVAKELEFIINMDIIVGLPGEDEEDILKTLEKLKEFEIDNLTVHMLALKKASNLFKEGFRQKELDGKIVGDKITEVVKEKKMNPYYMYRQKNSIDWGENIGYSVDGKESIFNIEMIEEYQDTIGIGGGAITKLMSGEKVSRIVNPKDPLVYVREFEERLKNKFKLIDEEYKK